ncbi:MAG: fatty-acid--CoA ligase [Acidimicrobiales bacterium]|nr:fatty-acid--CoA ligase [Acidimicrobiales bacterium]
MVPGWNFADVFEHIAGLVPEAPALVHDGTRRTWSEFDRRAGGVAAALTAAGLRRGDTVAQYLYNGNEYLESFFACCKAGLAPVNTNYRYVEGELAYLWDNADVAAVVFHGSFAERIEGVKDQLAVTLWLWVDDGSGPCPEWATPYEAATETEPVEHERDGDDLVLIYTGGTTGIPKGVMWRQDDLYNSYSQAIWKDPVEPDLEAVTVRVQRRLGPVVIPACPLMHGTGLFVALQQLCQAGCVVSLTARRLDIEELLDTIQAERVNVSAIVGDVFSKPMLAALDAHPGRWDISSLKVLVSSGAMWSAEVKAALLAHQPRLMLIDSFASSEAAGMGQSVARADAGARTATFTVGPFTRVITDDDRDVVPGSGEVGLVAAGGFQPMGYYKDEAKSAATFRMIDGRRYSIPGDHATVEVDGTLTFLGRGSTCINTGGEKVYPEEIEEALKLHPCVRDAVVLGVPDERFGEAVVAVVEGDVDPDELIAHAREHVAAYKVPKRIVPVDSVGRAPNGKVDHRRLREVAVSYIS